MPKRPILVVDDEKDILSSLKSLLRMDYDVYTAASGAEAIKVMQEHDIHIVVTDQRMPKMTGVEFLKQVKIKYPEAVRVIFTGYADVQAVIDAVNEGNIFRYVSKPWNPDDMLASLNAAAELYDHLTEREKLLQDLQSHEQKCLSFDDSLRTTKLEAIDPETATKLHNLFSEGRTLLDRLGSALKQVPGGENANV